MLISYIQTTLFFRYCNPRTLSTFATFSLFSCVDVVSSDICDEDQEKRDYVRSISKNAWRGLDWFRPSQRVIDLRPVSLYYVVGKLVAPDELWVVTYIDWRTAL
jgi:hypothetical protein